MSDQGERLLDELEALSAIMMDQLVIIQDKSGSPEAVEILLFPSTADDTQRQYVRLTLIVKFKEGYPDVSPTVLLKNPRGLDDDVILSIENEIKSKCEEYVGEPVVYELVQLVQEHLTQSNIPSCDCAICLYGFRNNDLFTKTDCYHYFHSYCLSHYILNMRRIFHEEQEKLPAWQRQKEPFQPLCPVCREPIVCSLEELQTAPEPVELENAESFMKSKELQDWQKRMSKLLDKQKERGGIVNSESQGAKLILLTEQDQESPIQESDNNPSVVVGSDLRSGSEESPHFVEAHVYSLPESRRTNYHRRGPRNYKPPRHNQQQSRPS